MYKLSNDIQQQKYIQWIYSPISLTGYYPLSYQTGGILILAELSTILGVNVSTTIYVWNIALILIIGILIYLISMNCTHDKFLSLIVVLIYLNARFLFHYTDWYFSVRNVFLMFFMFLLWLFIKYSRFLSL